MSIEESRKELGVGESDLRAINRAKNPNWLLMALMGSVVAIISFMIGYIVNKEEIGENTYPYSSICMASVSLANRRKAPWTIALLLAILALFSFAVGTAFSPHATFGEGSYYGVNARKV